VLYGAIAAAPLLALGCFALERLTGSKPHAQGGASIAVLPLANESGLGVTQYFSDGISEDLITALSQFPTLKVIRRTSALQFRDSKEDGSSHHNSPRFEVKARLGDLLSRRIAPRGAAQSIAVTAKAPCRATFLVPPHPWKNIPRVPHETTLGAAACGPRPD
jgi:hypothetical protein